MCKAEAKAYHLRKKQPNFYKHKLSKLINEACDVLIEIGEKSTSQEKATIGKEIYNKVHKDLMQILDDLVESVPRLDISFEKERDRLLVREELCKRRVELEEQIYKLKASEIDLDDLPEYKDDDELATSYEKTFVEIDKLERQLHDVSVHIAALEDKPIEEEVEFCLIVPPNSILNKLTQEQLSRLEQLMFKFASSQKNAKEINKTIIDGMLDVLDIDKSSFSKEELNILARDALDAYTQYFRMLADQRRHDFYDDLINNKTLEPKEGLILKDENDVSEEIRNKLDSIDREFKRKIEDCFENFAQRKELEDNYEEVEDDYDPIKETRDLLRTVKESNPIFAQSRVKEEPVDEYEIELEVGEDSIDDNQLVIEEDNNPNKIKVERSDGSKNDFQEPSPKMVKLEWLPRTSAPLNKHPPESRVQKTNAQTGINDYIEPSSSRNQITDERAHVKQEDYVSGDDDIEFIGVVEPAAKIKHVSLD